MLSMGLFPLRSMLGQFLCQASRKAPSLRKGLSEKGHRSRGSAEGWLRANGAVRTGSQVSADWHVLRRIASSANRSEGACCSQTALAKHLLRLASNWGGRRLQSWRQWPRQTRSSPGIASALLRSVLALSPVHLPAVLA
jgi:hypothetical protein